MNGHYDIGELVLEDWKLVRLLGEGSYGRVYEAEREDFGVVYKAAIKIITIPQSRSEILNAQAEGMDDASVTAYFRSFVEEIVQEFALMSKLKGTANVVSYEDHKVVPHEDGYGWDILIRMELLTPLLNYTVTHTLTRRDVIKLGIDICKALELCQRYNIVHRDIKPENIFLSELGDYKLGDFGIARTVEKTTGGLSKKGTYTYMAPEVYREEPYGSSVDVYAVGLVMYRLLNENRAPFLPAAPAPITHSDRENALAKRFSGAALPMPKNAEGRLAEIVLKASAFLPKDRYSSPSQMRQELESILYRPGEAPLIYPQGDAVPLDPDGKTDETVEPEQEATVSMFDVKPEQDATVSMFAAKPAAEAAEEDRTVSMFHSAEKPAAEPEKPKKKRKTGLLIVLLLLLAAGAAAYALLPHGGSVPEKPELEEPQQEEQQEEAAPEKEPLKLVSQNVVLVAGDTFRLETENGEGTLVWTSSDEAVATVDEQGIVTAVAPGEVTLTVTDGEGTEVSCKAVIEKKVIPATGVSLDQTSLKLTEKNTAQLTAAVSPADATETTVAWSSSDTGVASVESGLVTAKKPGSATITASCGEFTATCTVKVMRAKVRVSSVQISNASCSINRGGATWLSASVKPSNADDQTITWSSSNPGVASVDQSGKVQAIGDGTATVTASCGGKSSSCTVYVETVWSDWQDTWPEDKAPAIQERIVYRYRDNYWEETTSSESSMSGWQLDSTDEHVGSWSDWSDSSVSQSSTREVQTREVEVTPGHTEYRYGRWSDGTNNSFCPNFGSSNDGYGTPYSSWYEQYTDWMDTPYSKTIYHGFCAASGHHHTHVSGRDENGWDNWDIYSPDSGFQLKPSYWPVRWYWEETRWVDSVYKTQYCYRDTTYTYHYKRYVEGGWSGWSTSEPYDDTDRDISQKKQYRYLVF